MLEPIGWEGSAGVRRDWRPPFVALAGLAGAAIAVGLVVGLWPGSQIPSAALVVPLVLVILAHALAWRGRPTHELRPAWALVAIGMILTLTGELVRMVDEATPGRPLVVVAIGLNLLAYPCYLGASGVRIQRAAGRSISVAAMLDAMTCALVAGAFGAVVFLPHAVAVPPARLVGVVLPPLLCLGLLVVALYLVFQTARERPQPAALALVTGALLTALGNWLIALDTLGTAPPWSLPLAMMLLVAGFLALACLPTLDARATGRWPDPIGHLQSVLVQALPLVLLALLAAQVVSQPASQDDGSALSPLLLQRALAIGTLLVVVRQALMLRLNVRLLTSLQSTNAALAHAHAHAAREARTDNLTGLPNRRLLIEYLSTAVAAHRRAGLPLTLLFVDLDYFKQVNDRYGHAAGDAVLIEVGRRLRQILREGDTVARAGGEEFVLLLPHTDERDGQAVAERVRRAVSAVPVSIDTAGPIAVTASVGLATSRSGAMSAEELLRAADEGMYAAKHAGRDGIGVTAG